MFHGMRMQDWHAIAQWAGFRNGLEAKQFAEQQQAKADKRQRRQLREAR